MKIKDESLSSLNKKGVYSITCDNGKRYIGSTKKSFLSRMNKHVSMLKINKHPTGHLQLAWNKYSSDLFTFDVLEVIENNEIVEVREAYWIEFYNSANREKGYNINPYPKKAPSSTKESREKIAETRRRRFASGEISLNEGNFKKGIQVWNKGRKYKSTEHLKVPKTMTEKLRMKYKNHLRNKMLPVEVYKDGTLLGVWKNHMELQEYSLSENNILPVESKYLGEMRRGKPRNFLSYARIKLAAKQDSSYKGLKFKYQTGPSTEQSVETIIEQKR